MKQMFLDIIVGGGSYTLFWFVLVPALLMIGMMSDVNGGVLVVEGYKELFDMVLTSLK